LGKVRTGPEGARLLRQAHFDIVINTGGTLGWVVRKDSPKLSATINEFLKTHRQGTAFGLQLIAR
jgi:hypothetical protein